MVTCKVLHVMELPGAEGVGSITVAIAVGEGKGVGVLPRPIVVVQAVRRMNPIIRKPDVFFMETLVLI